jgi:HSP20 family protein
MANVTRFDPFQSMTRYDPFNLSGNMREIFDAFMHPQWMSDMGMGQMGGIKLDLVEKDKNYIVYAEIPGFKKEDIDIEVDGHTVTISADTQRSVEHKSGENYIMRERHVGRIERSFTLEHFVDEGEVEAKYSDGVLEITLPKKNGGRTKHINVQ